MTDRPEFTAPQVLELINDLDYSRLDHWARTGVLEPSINAPKGQGRKRKYSMLDVVILRILSKLRSEGVGKDTLRRVAKLFREEEKQILCASADLWFVTNGQDFSIFTNDAMELLSVASEETLFWTMPIGMMVQGLKVSVYSKLMQENAEKTG